MNEDGRMARFKDLVIFSKKHKIKIGSIENLISYRLKKEKFILNYETQNLKNKKFKNIEIRKYKNKLDNSINYVIKRGNLRKNKKIGVRVISIKLKDKNLLKNKMVYNSLKYLYNFTNFALIIIKDNKTLKQKISENSQGTNILRYYGIGAQIIKDLGIKNMILVTKSKKKIIGLDGFDIKIIKQEIIK